MRIFISYASEHRPLAEALAIELRALGHRIFIDRHDLAPGETYTDQIRTSIAQSELFVFLISPEAVTPGRYTMSELQIMQEAAPSPGQRVLPVLAKPTPMETIPDYLRNLTILVPVGDLVTETVNAIAGLESRAKLRRRAKAVSLTLGGCALAAVLAGYAFYSSRTPVATTVREPFTVYGTNFLKSDETAVVSVTNKRPDLFKDYTCLVKAPEMKPNIVSLDYDEHCEKITIKANSGPFVMPNGDPIKLTSYYRTPMDIEISAKHGAVIWRGTWQIGFQNPLTDDEIFRPPE